MFEGVFISVLHDCVQTFLEFSRRQCQSTKALLDVFRNAGAIRDAISSTAIVE